MKVRALIKRKPVVIRRDSTIIEAARLMVQENVGLLVVVDEKGETPLGVVSERDILRSYAANTPPNTSVWNIATKSPVTATLEEDVGSAATKMVNKKIRHLVVVDEAGRLAGVLSIRDLVAEKSTLKAIVSSYEYEPFAGGD
ncbi:MAG: CBS domain-containing protein [Thermoprotei archaeon]